MGEETHISLETLADRELGSMLRCTVAALRRMRREKRGPRWTHVGKLVRYPRKWVENWIAANEGGL